jgi:leucyl aminopeptidase
MLPLSSKNYRTPTARAPGADDDGSGTVTLLSAFRGLANSGFKPEKTVEFHWYAAEEDGLLGSRDVAMSYKKRDAEVAAMVQVNKNGRLIQYRRALNAHTSLT